MDAEKQRGDGMKREDAIPVWMIVGGESGPGFRPMDHAWAREIRDQCHGSTSLAVPEQGRRERQHVAFFFKQSAAIRTEMRTELDGREWKEYPK